MAGLKSELRGHLRQGRLDAFEWLAKRRLLPQADNFTRFIVLGMGRTGSNVLASSLRNHPDALCFGELFNNRVLWAYPGYRHTDAQARWRDAAPADFIEQQVFGRPIPAGIKAVGFKLFYYHTEAWRQLEAMDLRVIHLKRLNLLELIVSMARALDGGPWAGRSRHDEHVTLDPHELRASFERIEAWWQEFDERFPHALQVTYEDLVADTNAVMNRVCRYLELPDYELSSGMRKQEWRPMRERIANFDDLREQFSGTRWSCFFEEQHPPERSHSPNNPPILRS